MTSQVVLINQAGIAVASDSMVSWRRGKTLPTSSKIFELGLDHRVVVLHSGRTAIGGVQFETLIREWAHQLPPYIATLSDYVKNFDDWLVTGMKKFDVSEEILIKEVVAGEFSDFVEGRWFDWYLDPEFWSGVEEDNDRRCEIATAKLNENLTSYRARFFTSDDVGTYADLSETQCRKMLRDLDVLHEFKRAAAAYFRTADVDFNLINSSSDELVLFAAELLGHRVYSADSSARLNFVGFGVEEPIGGCVEVEVRSIYGGHIRGTGVQAREPAAGSLEVGIFLIAQSQTMELLINGTNHRIWHALNEEFDCVWKAVDHSPEERDLTFKATYIEHVMENLRHQSRHAVEDTIRSLNLSALTVFADSLLRLEVLGAVSRDEVATVGGLVEVLSISRREGGIQWHRKLSADLDHRQASSHLLG